MTSQSVSIGGDASGNVIVAGKNNRVDGKISSSLTKISLPQPEAVDISRELAAIQDVLRGIGGQYTGKIGRAIEHATEEAGRPEPAKDEVGTALQRALEFASKATDYADKIEKLAPHLKSAVAWLGSNWQSLLSFVGLTA